ncbi:pyridoxal-phosphate dependent enzyme [soil metagenome]
MTPLTFDSVKTAAARIRPFIRRTPVLTSHTLDRLAGRKVFFKCELFQTTGSFKYRGATNAVQSLDEASARRGVITHSSGNHGQALAKAAQVRGIPATIVMPATGSPIKKAAVLGYGATVVECGPSSPEREAKVKELQQTNDAMLIPPFDHPDVIAGQGTAALELLEDEPTLDAILAPVGGGGMISGFCLAAKGINPALRVFGAEPLNGNDAALSKAKGERVKLDKVTSIADGLLTNYLGDLTWPIVRDQVEVIYTVTEDDIKAAMRLVWERMKLLIEPSAAVGVAVILSDEFRKLPGIESIGVVLCGGNVSLDKLFWQ